MPRRLASSRPTVVLPEPGMPTRTTREGLRMKQLERPKKPCNYRHGLIVTVRELAEPLGEVTVSVNVPDGVVAHFEPVTVKV